MPANSTDQASMLNHSDAYQRFEETKRKNFSHSSRLEGIRLSADKTDVTLEAVLKRYQANVNG